MLAAHFDEPEETAMYKVEEFEQLRRAARDLPLHR
jgi:hypothetical protein